MPKTVTYEGSEQHSGYTFSPLDFAKAGVEVKDEIFFPTGEPVEVINEVADLLLETDPEKSPIFYSYPFSEVKPDTKAAKAADKAEKARLKAEENMKAKADAEAKAEAERLEAMTESGTPQEVDSDPAGGDGTGATPTSTATS